MIPKYGKVQQQKYYLMFLMLGNIELHLLRLHYYNNMKEISSYIIEKLHLDKNIEITNKTFIGVFGLSDDKKGVSFK